MVDADTVIIIKIGHLASKLDRGIVFAVTQDDLSEFRRATNEVLNGFVVE